MRALVRLPRSDPVAVACRAALREKKSDEAHEGPYRLRKFSSKNHLWTSVAKIPALECRLMGYEQTCQQHGPNSRL